MNWRLPVRCFLIASCAFTASTMGSVLAATEDVLSPVLQGEFALQAGDDALAARNYVEAALKVDDPALAKRATEIALLGHQDRLATRALARWRQLDPASKDAVSAEALLALRTGDRATARRDLLAMLSAGNAGWKDAIRVLASATDSATSVLVAGDLFAQGHWPRDINAWLAFGAVSQRLGDAGLTRRIVGESVRRFPNDARAWLLESARLREQGDPAGARRAVDRALVSEIHDAGVRNVIASELALLNDPKAAAAALAGGPQDTASYIGRAAYLAQSDDNSGLDKLYVEVKSLAPKPDAQRQLLLGQLAEYLKHGDEALAWYRGISKGAAYGDARNRIAIVLAARGDLDGALQILRDQQHDDAVDDEAQIESYQLEAELLAQHGRKDEALAAYGRGLAMFDGDTGLLYGRALLLEGMDRIADAETDLRNIIAMEPDNAQALNALGFTLADRSRNYAEAQVLIEHALRMQPDSPAILDSLGWVQHRLGRNAEALHNLRRAFALQKDAEIAAHLGEVLWLAGDKDAARVVWMQGLAIDKDNRAMQRVVQEFHP